MLKLNASYSKKVPAETEYSSQSYHAQIEIELPDGLNQQQLQEKVHSVFDFVRNSVEAELNNASQTASSAQLAQQPVQPQSTPQYYEHQQNYQQAQNATRQFKNSNAAASSKQVNYLLSLAKRAGWTVQHILQRCQVAAVDQIPSRVCSQLIQELSGAAA